MSPLADPTLAGLLLVVSCATPVPTPGPSMTPAPTPAASTYAAPTPAAPTPVPEPDQASIPRAILVFSVEPANTYSGDLVTIKGTGLNQGSVLLLGPVSPVIVEKTNDKIVFRAPETDHNRP
ncbi:MAG: IPT/TIG domain-containing protein, partial [Thermoanaerobaculia bacterium]